MSKRKSLVKKALFSLILIFFGIATNSMLGMDISETEMDKERLKQVSPAPKIDADYIYGIDKLRPGWEGMKGARILKDHFGKGNDAFEVMHGTSSKTFWTGRAVFWYWPIEKIEKGKYFITLWVETGCDQLRTEYYPSSLMATVYLNGWPVRFSTSSDPVQVRPGVWLAELQSEKAVEIKDGDEIEVCPANGAQTGDPKRIFRLALYKKEPKRGHGVTGQTFSIHSGVPQRVRLALEADIFGDGKDGGKHKAQVKVANPLPYEVEADITWKLTDHYGKPIAGKTERIKLAPHKTTMIRHDFTASGEEKAYRIDVKSKPAPGFKFPVKRPVELLKLNDYSQMEFLPNQPDPLTVWEHERKEIVDKRSGYEKVFPLNGKGWEEAVGDGLQTPNSIPGDLDFKACKHGYSGRRLPQKSSARWYRKKFTAPKWMRGEKYLIKIKDKAAETTVFVNGQIARRLIAYRTPKEFNVSKLIHPEKENEIVICLRGPVAAVNPNFVPEFDKANRKAIKKNLNYPVSVKNSKASLKSVVLQACPILYISQTLVVTDFKRKTLRVFTRVKNLDDREHEAKLQFELFQTGEKIPIDAPERKIRLKAGEKKEFLTEIKLGKSLLSQTAKDATDALSSKKNKTLKPYTPENPITAKLSTILLLDGKKINDFNQRFGYRSLKVEGTEITLNGQPVNLLGGCFCPKGFFLEGESGTDTGRRFDFYEQPYRNIEIADEIGILTYPRNIVDDTQPWKILNNETYWDRMCDSQLELTWRYGSHPSVIGWDISNESYHYATLHHLGRESAIKHGERIASLAEEVKEKIWPDYFFVADGDRALGDRINFCSFHYLNSSLLQGYFKTRPDKGPSKDTSPFPPDCFFLGGAKKELPKGTVFGGLPGMEKGWEYGSCPSGDTETLGFTSKCNATGMAALIGDRATVSTNWLFQTGRGMYFAKQVLEGLRDLEQSFIIPCGWHDFFNPIWQDLAFSMPEQQIRYYSGTKFDRRINIHDDEYKPGNLEFKWKLTDLSGKVIEQDDIKAKSDTAYLKRDRVSFDVPKVNKRTKFKLVMELWKDGKKRAYEDRIVDVWPLSSKKTSGKASTTELTVYDPNNMLIPILNKMGYATKALKKLDKESLAGLKSLIIGPDCAKEDMLAYGKPMKSFIENGGRVILLRQHKSVLKKAGVNFEPKAWYSIGFVRVPEHPLVKGLEDMDFQMWNPDHLISKGNYIKPKKGSYIALVDSGFQGTMKWTPLIELYLGKGSVIAAQFPLTEAFDTEPMCAEVLKRTIAYLEEPIFRNPNKQLAVVKGASESILKRLKEVRTNYREIPEPNANHPVTLLDLGAKSLIPDIEKLRDYLENGGTLIAHGAAPENKKLLEKLSGKPVTIQAQPYQAWVDRQMLDRRDGLATGLNNLDLYWRPLLSNLDWNSKMQISKGLEFGKGQVRYVVKVDGAKDYLFPGGLLEIPVGKGRLIVDQLNWDMPDREMLCGSPCRVISNFLTNLGIKRSLPKEKVSMPKNMVYEPIDLGAFANLSLADKKAKDGKGWCDWGPEQVLGTFPVGTTSKFHHVPFSIPKGENNAVSLRVNPNWLPSLAKHPEKIVIPINKSQVAGLWFLHTGGWIKGSGTLGVRIVEYSDGNKETIPIDVSNAADWNFGRDSFPDEEGTLTMVAWKGKCKKNPVTRVYQTYWPNPHPEKEIKHITLSNLGFKEQSFTPLLGITVAKKSDKTKADTSKMTIAMDPEKSRKLFKEALSLIGAGKENEAELKLKEAIKANDKNSGAWMAFCEIRAKKDDVKTFTKLCRSWMKIIPDNPSAHNILGKYYEDKNMLREALREYEKSYKIKWNQPPIDKAMARVKRKLNEKK